MKTSYDIILTPVISEMSMDNAALKKYTFKVAPTATRTEIKAAIEQAFGVEIAKINILNVSGKLRRRGMTKGYTAGYKKAVVTLTANSKTIELFEGL